MSDLWRELGWRTYYIHIYVCMSRHLSLLPYSFSPLQLILIRPKYSFLLWLSGNVNLGSDRMNNHLDSCDSRNKTISERYHFPRKLLNDKIWFVDNCLNQITNQGPSIQWSTIAAMKETSWAQMVTYDRKSWKKVPSTSMKSLTVPLKTSDQSWSKLFQLRSTLFQSLKIGRYFACKNDRMIYAQEPIISFHLQVYVQSDSHFSKFEGLFGRK